MTEKLLVLGKFLTTLGIFLTMSMFTLWFLAIWFGGDIGGKLGASGAILILPTIVLLLFGIPLWYSNWEKKEKARLKRDRGVI